MGYETFDNNRSRRFMELMAEYDTIDYEAFKRIKYDGRLPAELAYLTRFDSLFRLDPQRYPKLAPLIEGLRAWDHGSEAESRGAVYFQLVSYYVFEQQGLDLYDAHTVTEAEAVQALEASRRWLMKHYKTLDVTLGQCQQLVRGELRLPLAGLPDVLAAIYSRPGKDGIIRGSGGESYIELVRFTPSGPVIESVNVYGASSRPESPHYADQAPLFVRQRTKRMYLDRAEVYRRAAKVYGIE
jgi:acyl-homoserine-lactone acylase